MKLLMVGANYKRTPFEWREALMLTRTEHGRTVRWFMEENRIDEVMILQTCNRVEFYFRLHGEEIPERVRNWLSGRLRMNWQSLRESLMVCWDLTAVNHLFRVAAGLDSMVLGEEQILGQVREAYLSGIEAGGVSTFFHQLMSEALRVGKEVRTETGISRSGISVSTAAVEWIKEHCPTPHSLRALVLGAGEMGQLALSSLFDAGVRDLTVLNRSEDRGRALAEQWGGKVLSWEEKRRALREADVIISSTGAPHYVITQEDLKGAGHTPQHPLLVIDLAVPRDVEPGVEAMPGIQVCRIDDLQAKAVALCGLRRDRVSEAVAMVEREVGVFGHWLRSRNAVPVIRALREKGEIIRRQELEKVQEKLREFDEREQQLIQEVTQKIVARLLHEPTVQLKELVQQEEEGDYLNLVCRLYNLPQSKGG